MSKLIVDDIASGSFEKKDSEITFGHQEGGGGIGQSEGLVSHRVAEPGAGDADVVDIQSYFRGDRIVSVIEEDQHCP